jgi:hypothetical protein
VHALARGAALVAAAALGGCYRYAPVTPAALPTSARVRVGLSAEGASALEPTVGTAVSAVEGALVRQGGDTLVVRADKLLTTAGVDVAWSGGDLRLPAAWRGEVTRRRLSPGRSALLAAGGAAVSVAVIALVRSLGDSQGGPGAGGGPIQVSRGRP